MLDRNKFYNIGIKIYIIIYKIYKSSYKKLLAEAYIFNFK